MLFNLIYLQDQICAQEIFPSKISKPIYRLASDERVNLVLRLSRPKYMLPQVLNAHGDCRAFACYFYATKRQFCPGLFSVSLWLQSRLRSNVYSLFVLIMKRICLLKRKFKILKNAIENDNLSYGKKRIGNLCHETR
jgi:hypothetical protein